MADRFDALRGVGASLAAITIAVAALAVAREPSQAQQFTMKFATQTINDVQHEYIKVFKRELEQATNNRIKVEVYPASQLGGAPRQTEGLRLGTIEAAIGPAELFVGADPRFQVPALAGLYRDREHLRRMVEVPQFRKAIFDVAAARGTVGMSIIAYDMQSFVFKAPVSKIADFSGKRIRVLASEGEQSAIASLGGSSVPMSLPEVLPALQQGTIDGVNSVLGVFVAFRYHDAAQNLVDTALWPISSSGLGEQDFLRPTAARPAEDGAGNRGKNRARACEMADRAHRERYQGLGRQGRQVRQAFASGTAGSGAAGIRCGASGGRQERSAEGPLRSAQGHHRIRELTRASRE